MAPIVAHTTVADCQLRPRFSYEPDVVNYRPERPCAQALPMSEGFLDYWGFFTALREGGSCGAVAYEMCSPLFGRGSVENLDRHARAFLNYFNALPV